MLSNLQELKTNSMQQHGRLDIDRLSSLDQPIPAPRESFQEEREKECVLQELDVDSTSQNS